MSEPKISVIIPYFRGDKYIAETLNSVFEQNYSNLEVIIANDGSPVETLKVLEPFQNKIKIVSQENKGQAAARNIGINNSTGEIIAFTDQDDLWDNNHLSLMLPYLVNNNEIDYVQGFSTQFMLKTDGQKQTDQSILRAELVGSAIFRKKVFSVVGLFDESMREGEDFDWTLRLKESPCVGKTINDNVFWHRLHDTNLSKTTDFIKKGQLMAIRNKLTRERKNKSSNV